MAIQETNALFSAISRLEDDIRAITRWGEVLLHLSSSEIEDNEGIVLMTVSRAITEFGKQIEAKYDAIFDMAAARRFDQ